MAAELPRAAAWAYEHTGAPDGWPQALLWAFAHCDERVGEAELSSALLVAEGLYVASCGTARCAVGSVVQGGLLVDEASVAHGAESELEQERLKGGGPPRHLPWRGLGGHGLKQQHPGIIGVPDVVRIPPAPSRRLLVLASEAVWASGARRPLERAYWALETGEDGDLWLKRP